MKKVCANNWQTDRKEQRIEKNHSIKSYKFY